MAVIKCKMCGGDIELAADKTFGTCEFCGSTMTLPKVDDDQRAAAFNRGNHFRRIGEFDKALAVYERIVREDDTDAEAHWCCALCRFGIEYVEDPATYEWLPTCHRASFDSFLEDVDYLAALEHSDGITRRQYQKDGAKIAEVQRGILATSQNEEPFDVFICYKESDENGERTKDSLMAQDIYYQLTDQGYRVFFSRITLEDMAGREYEPYIFAALNSAKVMIVVGTKPEYLNAVWVKNEWSRFLVMMKKDRHKLLLPCYRDMDPYDMPEQLAVLQSYDMGKIGFIQDLSRGISKVLNADKKPEPVKETLVVQQAAAPAPASDVGALLRRVEMFLEDEDWQGANEYCEKVLDIDPENARAYLSKVLAQEKCRTIDVLVRKRLEKYRDAENHTLYLDEKTAYVEEMVDKYALPGYLRDSAVHALYQFDLRYLSQVRSREEQYQQEKNWWGTHKLLTRAEKFAAGEFAEKWAAKKNELFDQLSQRIRAAEAAEAAARQNAENKYAAHIAAAGKQAQQLREEAEQKRERRAKNKKIAIVAAAVMLTIVIAVLLVTKVIIYKDAIALMEAGSYREALAEFDALDGYKDSAEQANALRVQLAVRDTISAGRYHTVGLKADGTVVAVGDNCYGQCKVAGWSDIIAISAGLYHTVGLKSDGTVVAVGNNAYGQCDVEGWSDIIAISAGFDHTVGLKADGTVVAVGNNGDGQCDVESWSDIVSISAGGYHTIGLKADGTVVAVGYDEYGQCDVKSWSDIIAISAGSHHTVGLKADGTVVAVGYNKYGQCNVESWSDIVSISAGGYHTIGLKADGTVVAVGYNSNGQRNAKSWSDIVSISAGDSHTVGLKADGTVVAVGDNYFGQCKVSGWKDIKTPETAE